MLGAERLLALGRARRVAGSLDATRARRQAKRDVPARPCSSPRCRSLRSVSRWDDVRRRWTRPPREGEARPSVATRHLDTVEALRGAFFCLTVTWLDPKLMGYPTSSPDSFAAVKSR